MRNQFARTMADVGQVDPNLFIVVGDIGVFGLREFWQKWPTRFLNAGIREQVIASVAAGLSKTGFTPVIHSITPFIVERCFEQIKVDLCYQKLSGNIVSVGSGMDYGALGGTHHSYSDIAMFRSLPGARIFTPGSANEFDLLFRANYKTEVNYFRLGARSHGTTVPDELIISSKACRVSEGDRLTVVTLGPLLKDCFDALNEADLFSQCEIVYYSTVKPFDADTLIKSVLKTRKVLVVEDHNVFGGLADQVSSSLVKASVHATMISLGVQDRFVHQYGSGEEIKRAVGIDAAAIVAAAKDLLMRVNA